MVRLFSPSLPCQLCIDRVCPTDAAGAGVAEATGDAAAGVADADDADAAAGDADDAANGADSLSVFC